MYIAIVNIPCNFLWKSNLEKADENNFTMLNFQNIPNLKGTFALKAIAIKRANHTIT